MINQNKLGLSLQRLTVKNGRKLPLVQQYSCEARDPHMELAVKISSGKWKHWSFGRSGGASVWPTFTFSSTTRMNEPFPKRESERERFWSKFYYRISFRNSWSMYALESLLLESAPAARHVCECLCVFVVSLKPWWIRQEGPLKFSQSSSPHQWNPELM